MDQRLPAGSSVNLGLPVSDSVDQRLPASCSVKQQLPTDVSMDQRLPAGGSVNQGLAADGSVNQGLPAGGSVNDGLPASDRVDQRIPVGGSVDQRLPAGGSVDQGLPASGCVDKPLPTGGSVDQRLLLCSLCGHFLIAPRMLPCLHAFCLKCLTQNVTKQRRRKSSVLEVSLMPRATSQISTSGTYMYTIKVHRSMCSGFFLSFLFCFYLLFVSPCRTKRNMLSIISQHKSSGCKQ